MACNFAPHLGLRVGRDQYPPHATSSEVEFRADDNSISESAPTGGKDGSKVVVSVSPVEPTLELVIAFCVWAHDRDSFPTTEDVIERFNVAAWDADRWRRTLAAAYGVTP